MPVFLAPEDLIEVAHFSIPKVQTWGDPPKDKQYKIWIQEIANLPQGIGNDFEYFVFSMNSIISASRRRKVGPDVENIPKLIVDAFTGILYPDDNLYYVRAVQVEAIFGPDEQEHTEVWIYGKRKQ